MWKTFKEPKKSAAKPAAQEQHAQEQHAMAQSGAAQSGVAQHAVAASHDRATRDPHRPQPAARNPDAGVPQLAKPRVASPAASRRVPNPPPVADALAAANPRENTAPNGSPQRGPAFVALGVPPTARGSTTIVFRGFSCLFVATRLPQCRVAGRNRAVIMNNAGTKYNASIVAPPTPPAIAIANGGQKPPPCHNNGVKPAIVVRDVATM